MTGQTRCCMLHRREQVKNYDVKKKKKKKKRKNVENRTSSLLLTNVRTTTSNKPSNNRPFDCDVLHSFFVLCSLVMSCPFYSFFLVLVHDSDRFTNYQFRCTIKTKQSNINDHTVLERSFSCPSLLLRLFVTLNLRCASFSLYTHAHDQCTRP